MITYRPSIGNNETKVGVNNDGKFFGKSTGGKVLLNLRTNDEPKSTYYKNNYTDLSNESSWFFKSITDTDFLKGSETYRAIYIGASEKYEENEILGTISTNVTNDNGNPSLNNSVTTKLWVEGGVYNELSSNDSINLQDENDRYNQLLSASWTNSITSNDILKPGQFIKVWVKVTVPANASIVDFSNFNYLITVGGLTFTVRKTPSRISYSRLFKTPLNSEKIILKEAMTSEFGTSNFDGIFKIIKKETQTNIFYITNCEQGNLTDYDPSVNELRLMTIKTGDNLGEQKYIDVPLTPLFNNSEVLKEENYLKYLKVMTCELPITVHATDSNGGQTENNYNNLSISVGTSGLGYITDFASNLPNRKFIVDVFMSNKEDINYAYVFFAELHTDYSPREILNYQHVFYKWVLKVAAIDLNHINDKLFSNVDFGYENKHTSLITDYYEKELKSYFYPSNILMQDDLFTISGFETEDCYFKNYKGKLLFVWEKDLILRNLKVQESIFPKNDYSSFRTVENLTHTPTLLKFNNLTQVSPNTDVNRTYISGSYEYINMLSPHTKAVNHGNSSITFDLENSQINEYTSTWSFVVSSENLDISGGKTSLIGYDIFDPRSIHSLYQSTFNSISGGANVSISGSNLLNAPLTIFTLNCQDEILESSLSVAYNFNNEEWTITRNTSACESITETISGSSLPKLFADQQSIITADIFSHEISGGTTTEHFPGGFRINNGCLKRNIINYKIYVNGSLLTTGTTCSLNNVNIYQITHNPYNNFSGLISFWEIRPSVEDISSYVSALHKVHLNVVWGKLDEEKSVISNNPLFNNFNCRRRVSLSNLTPFKDTMIVPLVLYGNSYNINKLNNNTLNEQITRSIFDFNKLSLNKKSFGFFIEKTFKPVEFDVQPYDFDNDILVIWLKLEGWSGEAIQMFYSDAMLNSVDLPNIYKDYYGFWRMDSFKKEDINRFSNHKLFDIGETVLMTKKDNNVYLSLINNIVKFGNSKYYKSNYFDVEFNDISVNKEEMQKVQEFIRENVALFKPSYMEIRDVKSLYDYKLETNNTGDK